MHDPANDTARILRAAWRASGDLYDATIAYRANPCAGTRAALEAAVDRLVDAADPVYRRGVIVPDIAAAHGRGYFARQFRHVDAVIAGKVAP